MIPYDIPYNWTVNQYKLAINIYYLSLWLMDKKIIHEYLPMEEENTVRLLIPCKQNDVFVLPLRYSSNIAEYKQMIQSYINCNIIKPYKAR